MFVGLVRAIDRAGKCRVQTLNIFHFNFSFFFNLCESNLSLDVKADKSQIKIDFYND